jgi:hypothetical protein
MSCGSRRGRSRKIWARCRSEPRDVCTETLSFPKIPSGADSRSLNKDAPIYARSSTWAASHLRPSSAASITTIAESSFQYTHPSVLRISPTRRRPGLSPRTNQNMHRVHVRVVDVHSIYLRIEAGSLECGHKRVSGGPKSGFLAPMDLDGYV